MSVNICPPIIKQHCMPLDYSQWAEVAQKHGEPLSEAIHPKREIAVTYQEPHGYKATTAAMRKFNEQQRL